MYSQIYIPTDEGNWSLINDHDLFKLLSQQKKVFLVIPTDLEIQMDLITLKAQSNAMTECHNKLPLL